MFENRAVLALVVLILAFVAYRFYGKTESFTSCDKKNKRVRFTIGNAFEEPFQAPAGARRRAWGLIRDHVACDAAGGKWDAEKRMCHPA
jgi:hypothetical protein